MSDTLLRIDDGNRSAISLRTSIPVKWSNDNNSPIIEDVPVGFRNFSEWLVIRASCGDGRRNLLRHCAL